MKRGLAVLGSTGSIGTTTLDIVEKHPEEFRVVSLAAGSNLEKLSEQIRRFRPLCVSVAEERSAEHLRARFPELEVGWGEAGVKACIDAAEVEVAIVGIVGFAALAPTLHAVRAGKTVALANKETLVVGGELFKAEVAKSRALCIPVDSEHNAIHQLLLGRDRSEVQSIVLTASGGPLWRKPEMPLDDVTPAIATNHPNWRMGPKISVDSATLMNKGLELIEAHFLFDFPQERIEVWVHPQSILHGALWLTDNSCLAQLTKPDMKSSLGFALAYPRRLNAIIPKLTLGEMSRLEFFPPDDARFPCLGLARRALDAGAPSLIALNAANEVAVDAFLKGKLLFSRIPAVIEEVLAVTPGARVDGIERVFVLDAEARRIAGAVVARFHA